MPEIISPFEAWRDRNYPTDQREKPGTRGWIAETRPGSARARVPGELENAFLPSRTLDDARSILWGVSLRHPRTRSHGGTVSRSARPGMRRLKFQIASLTHLRELSQGGQMPKTWAKQQSRHGRRRSVRQRSGQLSLESPRIPHGLLFALEHCSA